MPKFPEKMSWGENFLKEREAGLLKFFQVILSDYEVSKHKIVRKYLEQFWDKSAPTYIDDVEET